MRRKVWLAILLLVALGFVAQAAISVTTGPVSTNYTTTVADNYLNSQNPVTVYRTGSITMRNTTDVSRILIPVLRFDLASVAGRNPAGATLSFAVTWSTGATNRAYDVWGLIDGTGDTWNSNTLTYTTASTAVPSGLGWIIQLPGQTGTYGYYNANTALWTRLGSVTINVPSGTPTSGGTVIVSTPAELNMESFLGYDTNNLVTLMITPSYFANNNWMNIASADVVASTPYPESFLPTLTFLGNEGAFDPQPAKNATILDLNTSQLCWTTLSGIQKCDVWFGPADVNSLDYKTRLTKIATIDNPAASQCVNIPAEMLPLSVPTTYSWVVDGYKGEPNLPAEPNFPGSIWKFHTTNLPVITAHPADQIKFEGETAEFTVAVTSISKVAYAWYRSPDYANNTPDDDVLVGTDSPTLTLTNLTRTDEGFYYCKATNDNGSSYSNLANLGVKRKVAHWALDELTSRQYTDSSGEGHHADPNDPNDTSVFVDGANPAVTGNGVAIDSNKGFASSGTWNPSDHTGQLSFSLWAKWAGQTTTASWQGLLAKVNSFGSNTMMWQLEIDATNNNVAYKNGSNNTITTTALPVGEWVHLTVTFDGTTARIYRNGVSVASGTVPFSGKTDANVNIGATAKSDAGLFSSFFNGVLDDIQMYNYPLTWNQVIDLYHTVSGQNICTNRPTRDLSGDCLVTMADFAMVAANWLECGLYPLCP
jgi:hypothetical protein